MLLRPLLAALPVLLVLVACRAPSSDERARDAAETEVREAVASLVGAMNRHDPEAVLAHYERSPAFTYLGVTDLRVGWDAFAGTVAFWYERHGDVTFEHDVVRVRALAPEVVVAVVRGSSTDAPALAWTLVWSRDVQGAWRIVHEHESWPGAEPPPRPHPM